MIRLYFDLVLSSDHDLPCWYLLPDRIWNIELLNEYSVDMIERYELKGKGRVVAGHFSGSKGFVAVLLPARANVRLRRFPIQFLGEIPVSIPKSVHIEAVIATRLMIGNRPAEEWLRETWLSDADAEVEAEPLRDQAEVLLVTHMPADRELPVTMEKIDSFEINVPITGDKS